MVSSIGKNYGDYSRLPSIFSIKRHIYQSTKEGDRISGSPRCQPQPLGLIAVLKWKPMKHTYHSITCMCIIKLQMLRLFPQKFRFKGFRVVPRKLLIQTLQGILTGIHPTLQQDKIHAACQGEEQGGGNSEHKREGHRLHSDRRDDVDDGWQSGPRLFVHP